MDLTIECADGTRLRGTEFAPRPDVDRGVTVIVCGAIFVRERFYARMAGWFAGRGFRVLTYANRGSGRSLADQNDTAAPRLLDWGLLDLPAVIAHARASRPNDRLFVIGHSMGGQVVGLSEAVHELEGIVSVAATEAWWGHWPRRSRLGILGAYVAIPLIGRALPTFPADRLALGPNLASSIARDWARWGRHRGYLWRDGRTRRELGAYRGRILALSFDDDALLGCRRAVDALHTRYVHADVTLRHVSPSEVGARHVGHFGYFRAEAGPRLWSETVAWIEGGG